MLSEPVSAQEEGGLILIFMGGATGGSIDVEDRMFESLFLLTLIKVLFINEFRVAFAMTKPSTLSIRVTAGRGGRILCMKVLSGVELWTGQKKFALGASMAIVVAMLIAVCVGATSAG